MLPGTIHSAVPHLLTERFGVRSLLTVCSSERLVPVQHATVERSAVRQGGASRGTLRPEPLIAC